MRTQIICSIGPSTESEEMIKALIENGMTVARMNFSHGTHEEHGKKIDLIRKWSKELNKDVVILCDLQGPKIRVQDFENPPLTLTEGQEVVLTTSVCNEIKPGEIVIEDPFLHSDVKPNDVILFDDGQIEMVVLKATNHKIACKVVVGGDLYPRKGVNLPYTQTTTSSLTGKDLKDLEFILTKDPDWVAISFVQNQNDVKRVKELIGDHRAKVMCKIERANALDNITEIIRETDGIMVARGDLGVEFPIEKLPIVQKQIITMCNDAGKPVATATQMLSNMTKNPFPTRAEVTDIANAVIDGTDAVMMSNETAVGQYPIEALKMMAKIVKTTEDYLYNRTNKL